MLAVLLACGTARASAELDEAFERSELVIEASDSACYSFDVWLALNGQQQARGLMHVRSLPRFSGMLFVYGTDAGRSMWMKNTLIPLDMLFIRADGSIATIARRTEPHSLASISSGEPVRYVLELNGGLAEELAIDTESRVHLPPALPADARD